MTSTIGTLVFEPLPLQHGYAPTKDDIRAALQTRPGEWAVVYRADRLARCEDHAARIIDGTVFGPGYEAEARSIGTRADARVYARYVGMPDVPRARHIYADQGADRTSCGVCGERPLHPIHG